MRSALISRLVSSNNAAVAPTVALSLFALIGVSGIAFDYARLATMDSELQAAADQAALAAATQLDGLTGACARAGNAARNLVLNQSRFANDGSGRDVTIPLESGCDAGGNVRLYQNQSKTLAATNDANAHFVEVSVNSRQARYALTPVVGALWSGAITGTAFAGLGSSVCKVPPLMMCNPNGSGAFDPDAYRGRGVRLVETQGNSASYAPGAFGYLNVGAANNGSPDQRAALGLNGAALSCLNSTTGDVDTGVSGNVMNALNVRFDIFENGWGRNTCFGSNNCNPAMNTTKDVVRSSSACNGNTGGLANNEWRLPPSADQYIPTNAAGDDANVTHMGYPMDVCHYATTNSCGRLGNGTWRPDIYFKVNHPTMVNASGSNWASASGLPSTASRYDVYQWEINSNNRPSPAAKAFTSGGGGNYRQYGAPLCKAGIPAGNGQPDRRVISVAIATNCAALHGSSVPVAIGGWMDVFLVQPAVARPDAGTAANELYVEIIGRSKAAGSGSSGAQAVLRDVPYLIE